MFKDVATIVAEKTINPETGRSYTVSGPVDACHVTVFHHMHCNVYAYVFLPGVHDPKRHEGLHPLQHPLQQEQQAAGHGGDPPAAQSDASSQGAHAPTSADSVFRCGSRQIANMLLCAVSRYAMLYALHIT
jgi:hypothetical protein